MNDGDKKLDSHIAYSAVMDGASSLIANVAIVGQYCWNFHMKLL